MANIEQSIKVGNGFALKAPSPVDLKTTAATIAERDSYVSQGVWLSRYDCLRGS